MAMSRDRVRFTVPSHRINKHHREAEVCRNVIKSIFGLDLEIAEWEDVTIVCRPSQFARFLIARNIAGLTNGFKELKPEMFILKEEEPKPIVYNVSKEHHDAHRCKELYTAKQ